MSEGYRKFSFRSYGKRQNNTEFNKSNKKWAALNQKCKNLRKCVPVNITVIPG